MQTLEVKILSHTTLNYFFLLNVYKSYYISGDDAEIESEEDFVCDSEDDLYSLYKSDTNSEID